MLSTELNEKEALRNTAQEQALTIHQLTLHLKLLQEASIENERETSSRYDIDKSFSLPDFDVSENLNSSQTSHKWGIESRKAIAVNELNRSDDVINRQVLNVSMVSSNSMYGNGNGNGNANGNTGKWTNGINEIKINEEKYRELDILMKSM